MEVNALRSHGTRAVNRSQFQNDRPDTLSVRNSRDIVQHQVGLNNTVVGISLIRSLHGYSRISRLQCRLQDCHRNSAVRHDLDQVLAGRAVYHCPLHVAGRLFADHCRVSGEVFRRCSPIASWHGRDYALLD